MPCSALARGIRQSAPHTGLAFDPAIDNSPCGRRIISTANAVSFAAHTNCLFHLKLKLGDKDISPPYVDAA